MSHNPAGFALVIWCDALCDGPIDSVDNGYCAYNCSASYSLTPMKLAVHLVIRDQLSFARHVTPTAVRYVRLEGMGNDIEM